MPIDINYSRCIYNTNSLRATAGNIVRYIFILFINNVISKLWRIFVGLKDIVEMFWSQQETVHKIVLILLYCWPVMADCGCEEVKEGGGVHKTITLVNVMNSENRDFENCMKYPIRELRLSWLCDILVEFLETWNSRVETILRETNVPNTKFRNLPI